LNHKRQESGDIDVAPATWRDQRDTDDFRGIRLPIGSMIDMKRVR